MRKPEAFRTVRRAHVIAWLKTLEGGALSALTIWRKLSALSPLYEYLCERNAVLGNPLDGVKRPLSNSNEGSTRTSLVLRRGGCWKHHQKTP